MARKRARGSWSRSSTELLRVGRVGRPHGTDGAFTVADPTQRVELLDPGSALIVGGRTMIVAARRGTPAHPIVVLEGVVDRSAAEDLRGQDITVRREALGALEEGEYLVDDLVGCDVFDGERRVGRVRDVLLLPSADALEVDVPGARPLLVPLITDAVRRVDAAARQIDVDMGFLE